MENDFDEKLYGQDLQHQCICRCCSTNKCELRPIFSSVGSIPEAVFLFTAVKFEEHDGLPKHICTTCLDQLNKFISFKRKVETVDLFFRKYLHECSQNILSSKEKALNFELQRQNLKEHDYSQSNISISPFNSNQSNEKTTSQVLSVKDEPASSTSNYSNNSKENVFRCNECSKKFRDKTAFDLHRICHTQKNVGGLICQICNDRFASEHDLFVHTSVHDNVNDFTCKSCSKQFSTLGKLKRHIPSHFLTKPFKCQMCGKGFTEMASLSRHYKVHIRTKPESIYFCLVCKKDFPNRYDLKVHTRKHTGERPWKCTTCNKDFTDFRLLNSHLKIHRDDKPYECKQCKRRFRHKSTLLNHTRTHSSIRPHRCDKCKKSYKQLWSLQLHKRSHAIRKQFLCNSCSQVFSSAASLKDHLRWHDSELHFDNVDAQKDTPSEFFQCNDCSLQFTSSLDLITHRKLTHALRHECDTCFGEWKTLEELVQHKCNEAVKLSDEPAPDEMILLPNGEMQDCKTVVNSLLASVSLPVTTTANEKKANNKKGKQ